MFLLQMEPGPAQGILTIINKYEYKYTSNTYEHEFKVSFALDTGKIEEDIGHAANFGWEGLTTPYFGPKWTLRNIIRNLPQHEILYRTCHSMKKHLAWQMTICQAKPTQCAQ